MKEESLLLLSDLQKLINQVVLIDYTIIILGADFMMTAKVFENGRSQAVRLPKECRFNTDEVAVNKIGEIVLLVPKSSKWNSFMQAIDMFSDDFMEDERDNDIKQERESL